MDKKICLEDGNVIRLNNDEGRIIINKGYLQNGEPSKMLVMLIFLKHILFQMKKQIA